MQQPPGGVGQGVGGQVDGVVNQLRLPGQARLDEEARFPGAATAQLHQAQAGGTLIEDCRRVLPQESGFDAGQVILGQLADLFEEGHARGIVKVLWNVRHPARPFRSERQR